MIFIRKKKVLKMIEERMDFLMKSYELYIRWINDLDCSESHEREACIRNSEIRIQQYLELNSLYQKIK